MYFLDVTIANINLEGCNYALVRDSRRRLQKLQNVYTASVFDTSKVGSSNMLRLTSVPKLLSD